MKAGGNKNAYLVLALLCEASSRAPCWNSGEKLGFHSLHSASPLFCSLFFVLLYLAPCVSLSVSLFFFFLFSQLFCPPCLFPSCVFFLFFSLSGFLPLFPLLSLVCLSPILSFVLCLHWRKTVVAAIAGLSCCRRRKWWLRSTRCHCFNGEEKKLQVLGLN